MSSEPCWICYRLDRIIWMQVLPLRSLEGEEVALGTNIMVACDACVNEMIVHDERVWKWANDGFYPSEYCDFMHEAYKEYREHNCQLLDDMENGGKLPLWPDELRDLTEQQIGTEKSECVAYGPPPEIKWWKFKASDYPFQPMEQDEDELAWSMSELDSETLDEGVEYVEYLDEFDQRTMDGLCVECGERKSTTTYLWERRHEIPVCEECSKLENETEMVWNEFILENGRAPSLKEYLEAGGLLEEEE